MLLERLQPFSTLLKPHMSNQEELVLARELAPARYYIFYSEAQRSGWVARRVSPESLCRLPVPLAVYYELNPFMLCRPTYLPLGGAARSGAVAENRPCILQKRKMYFSKK